VQKSKEFNHLSFKTFDLSHDVASLESPINETVSVSNGIFAPPFVGGSDANIKFFTNIATGSAVGLPNHYGYWQTVYDSAPTSIQSTALFDISFGYATSSAFFGNSISISASSNEKVKIYREMASVLLGGADSVFTIDGAPVTEAFFIMVKRGLAKDEIKKNSVTLFFTGVLAPLAKVSGTDAGAAQAYKQTVGGDYAPLLSGTTEVGQVWYNASVIIVPASSTGLPWSVTGSDGTYSSGIWSAWSGSTADPSSAPTSLNSMMASSSIDQLVDGLRGHLVSLALHNQTNLYSTIYFCRATNTEFNYSSNPTYIDDNARILVTSGSNVLQSRVYITTIGLYDANDNLLAVGKVNKPITKAPDTEAIFRIRLDY
jgi:hypothetical protein